MLASQFPPFQRHWFAFGLKKLFCGRLRFSPRYDHCDWDWGGFMVVCHKRDMVLPIFSGANRIEAWMLSIWEVVNTGDFVFDHDS